MNYQREVDMSKRKILFLDIDGVLNTERHHEYCYENGIDNSDEYGYLFDPMAVKNLARIVDESGACIVISSSWKYSGLSTLVDMWNDRALPGRVIDITPDTESDQFLLNADLENMEFLSCKGYEIKEWLTAHGKNVSQYAILDDEQEMLPEQQSHFVQTNPVVGISEEDAEKAITILNA